MAPNHDWTSTWRGGSYRRAKNSLKVVCGAIVIVVGLVTVVFHPLTALRAPSGGAAWVEWSSGRREERGEAGGTTAA
jgi:hypothetical protein